LGYKKVEGQLIVEDLNIWRRKEIQIHF
jgi:hypothetical protein